MADMMLCASGDCPVRERCRRNEACQDAYPVSEHWQSWSYWHLEAGAACPGFIETKKREATE